jgi:hypothetical protein
MGLWKHCSKWSIATHVAATPQVPLFNPALTQIIEIWLTHWLDSFVLPSTLSIRRLRLNPNFRLYQRVS